MTTIICKISEKLNAHLETLARRRRISKSAILREALESKTKASAGSAAPSAALREKWSTDPQFKWPRLLEEVDLMLQHILDRTT